MLLEQRNPYLGSPLRPWVRVTLIAADADGDGETRPCDLLADTGNPCAVIIGTQTMDTFNLGVTPGMQTNFGDLAGGWLRVQIPELRIDEDILVYASDAVVESAKASHWEFDGLAGLPLLQRMYEYDGDPDSFWIRTIE